MVVEFHFLSDVFPVDQRLSTIEDLRKYFAKLTENVKDLFDCSSYSAIRDKDTTVVLGDYYFDGLDIDKFLGDELKTMNVNDEKLICIKIMLIIYHHYVMTSKYFSLENYSLEIRPFICYIEEKILTKVFDCAKRLKKEANGVVKQFETGLEGMENWQLIILHLYIKLNLKDFSNWKLMNVCFPNSSLVSLTVLKYFSEKKQKYLQENHGHEWKIEHFNLFNDNLLFWIPLLRLFKESYILNFDQRVYRNFASHLFEHYLNVFIECVYGFCDFDTTNYQEHATRKLCTILGNTVNRYEGWKHFISLLKEDYNEVKDMNDLTVILNEKSRNFRRTARALKFQILSALGYTLQYNGFDLRNADLVNECYNILLNFKDFIIENMNRNSEKSLYENTMRDAAIMTSLGAACLNLEHLKEPPNNDFLDLVSTSFQLWKEHLVSNDIEKRKQINKIFILFCTKVQECPDDLLMAIIEAYEINRPNFDLYCQLLGETGKFFKTNQTSKIALESFQQVLNKIILTFQMEYFPNTKYLTEETKSMISNDIIIECLSMITELYYIFDDNFQFEQTLSIIKHISEELFKTKETWNEKRSMFFCLTITMDEIIDKTERIPLLAALDKLSYYSFLTKFIRFMLAEIVGDSEDIFLDFGPLPILLNHLCNTGIIFDCPYNVIQDTKENKDFLYDFLLPTILDIAILPVSFLTNFVEREENLNDLDSVADCCWVLGRILYNDTIRNGGERSLTKVDERMDKIMKVIELLQSRDSDNLLRYKDKLLSVVMLFIGKRMNFAQQIWACRSTVYSIYSFADMDQEERMHLFYCIFEYVEYMLDNGCMTVTSVDLDWIIDLESLKSDFPLSLRIHSQRIIEKINIELEHLDSDSDSHDEEI